MNAANTKVMMLRRNLLKRSKRSARYGINTGTNGMIVPSSVLTNPPDDATVTAVVVLKFDMMMSLPAEMSSKPAGERIRAIDRLVAIAFHPLTFLRAKDA
jgi:hypothetical protein